jgi:Lar family restriction alleviation protein
MNDIRKPCPFCGSQDTRIKHSGRWGWFVSCKCAAVGPSASIKQDAIDMWNMRVLVPEQMNLFEENKSERA